MAFRFKKSESPTKAVRRVASERVGAALECLEQAKRPAAVHGARKEIKKLRALFRLVRGEIQVGTYRKAVKALRAAADCLAAARDARVILKEFEKLVGSRAPAFAGIWRALKKNARRETKEFRKNDSAALAEKLLRKAGRRAGNLKIKATGWATIQPGLLQSYELGREAFQLARKKPVAENFHEWRKRAKDLWFYLCLLHPSQATRKLAGNLEILGEHLGEDHDLFMLQQFAAENCSAQSGAVKNLNCLVSSRQNELRAAALELGEELYGRAPAVFCKQLWPVSG